MAPFAGGDTPLQHYNMALSLATAGEVADAIVFWDNDDLMACARSGRRWATAAAAAAMDGRSAASSVAAARAAVRAERSGRGGPESAAVSTWDLNAVAAEALAGVVAPTYRRGKRRLHAGEDGCEPDGIGTAAGGLPRPKWVSVARGKGKGKAKGWDSSGIDGGSGKNDDGDGDDVDEGKHDGGDDEDRDDGDKADAGSDGDGDEEAEADDRDAWIRDSVSRRISASSSSRYGAATAAAAARRSSAASSPGGGSSLGAGAAVPALRLHALPLDGGALLADLMPQPALKYLDCRAASNDAAQTGGGVTGVLPGVTWADLADRLADTVPRYLSQGSAASAGAGAGGGASAKHRSVTTLAGGLWVRGARQTDCDSVDPTLPPLASASASASATAAGSSSAAASAGVRRGVTGAASSASAVHGPLWPGLPSSEEWGLVSAKLLRAYGLDKHPAYAPHSSSGLAALAGVTVGGTAAAFGHSRSRGAGVASAVSPPPLSAALTPSRAGVAGAALVPRHTHAGARSLTGLVNSDVAMPRLLACAERVESLLRLRAYVHWYERFGVGPAHLQAAAESLLDTVDAYAAAAAAARPAGR